MEENIINESPIEEALNSLENAIDEHIENNLTAEEREMMAEATGVVETSIEESERILTPEEEELLNSVIEEVHHEIPLNSNTALIKETTSRFSSAIWYQKIQEQIILLAGVGGIGSYVAFLLGRMKPKQLFIYDGDTVESANLSGQLYGGNDIGQSKVSAITSMLNTYADYYDVFAVNERYTKDNTAGPIMICGFDNMEARKIYYDNWLSFVNTQSEEDKKKCIFIDGRLAAEELQVFAIQGTDTRAMKDYEDNWLFGDTEADVTICSYKQTTFCANMIGSIIVNIFVNFIANQCDPLIERDVPYYTVYNAETMYFKTEA